MQRSRQQRTKRRRNIRYLLITCACVRSLSLSLSRTRLRIIAQFPHNSMNPDIPAFAKTPSSSGWQHRLSHSTATENKTCAQFNKTNQFKRLSSNFAQHNRKATAKPFFSTRPPVVHLVRHVVSALSPARQSAALPVVTCAASIAVPSLHVLWHPLSDEPQASILARLTHHLRSNCCRTT